MWFFKHEQPVAGPSSCPSLGVSPPQPPSSPLPKRKRQQQTPTSSISYANSQAISTLSSSSGALFQGPAVTFSTFNPSSISSSSQYSGGSQQPSSSSSSTSSSSSSSSTSASSSSSLSSSQIPNSYDTAQTSTTLSSGTISKPWSYTVTPSRTTSGVAPAQTTFVPGVVFNLTLAGADDSQAVYSVQIQMGHGGPDSTEDIALPGRSIYGRKRMNKRNWNGKDYQVLNFQVDLGSSDMWVAIDSCATSDCQSAPELFNVTQSLDTGSAANLTYESGAVSGEIYWEEVNIGSFGIGYQAFVGANYVSGEGLGTGNFSGLLGLALPADSIIFNEIGGTTSSDPDGATFLDNLFGSGNSAPTQRLFSLSLERREDVRTASTLGIGATDDRFCPPPCSPNYTKIISQPNLGTTGYLYWRVPIDSIHATQWANPSAGTGANTTTIPLGASQVDSAKSSPLAVLDSGGVEILVGYRPYADSIYSAFGISMSSDGYYRMPCTQQLAIAFTIGSVQIPIHPLDMSWTDPSDPSGQTCIGAIQYSSGLGQSGDFILGSTFLKNAYSVFQYPDTNKTTQLTWQPTVGLVPLTNASVASQDFYAVRSLGESLSSVSAAQQSSISASGSSAPVSSSTSSSASHIASTAVTAAIAASSVVGFFVIAAAAFCAWWFWLRRKFGESGMVEYSQPDGESSTEDKDGMFGLGGAYSVLRGSTNGRRGGTAGAGVRHYSDHSISSSRSRKHDNTKRQKSIVDGLSDYEAEDGWGTEGTDSIRLGYLPGLAEEDHDGARGYRAADERSFDSFALGLDGISNGVGSTLPVRSHTTTRQNRDSSSGTSPLVDLSSPTHPRASIAPTPLLVSGVSSPTVPSPATFTTTAVAGADAGSVASAGVGALPTTSSPPSSPSPPKMSRSTISRPPTYAMSGPFPSPSRPLTLFNNGTPGLGVGGNSNRPNEFDMDYFNMLSAGTVGGNSGSSQSQQRGSSPQRERGRSGVSEFSRSGGGKTRSGSSSSPRSMLRMPVLEDSLVEEPANMEDSNKAAGAAG